MTTAPNPAWLAFLLLLAARASATVVLVPEALPTPRPDTVVLDSGAILKGIILQKDAGGVQLSTGARSTFRIPWGKISCLQTASIAEAQKPQSAAASDASPTTGAATPTLPSPTGAAPASLPGPAAGSLSAMGSRAEPAGGLRIGALLVIGSANARLAPDYSTTSRTGLGAELYVEKSLTHSFSVETGVQYSQLGFSQVSRDLRTALHFDAVEFPIFAKLRLDPGKPELRFHLLAGPVLGWRLSASRAGNGQTVDVGDQLETTLFGIAVGGGVEYRLDPRVALRLELRHGFGLTNLSRSGGSIRRSDSGFVAGLGLRL